MGLPSPMPVRPARILSWRCKSSRELTTVSEVNPNCGEVTSRGEEGWIETVSRCTKIRYEARPTKTSERAIAKSLWSKVRERRSGGDAGKDNVLTWRDPECAPERETTSKEVVLRKSAEVVVPGANPGRTKREKGDDARGSW